MLTPSWTALRYSHAMYAVFGPATATAKRLERIEILFMMRVEFPSLLSAPKRQRLALGDASPHRMVMNAHSVAALSSAREPWQATSMRITSNAMAAARAMVIFNDETCTTTPWRTLARQADPG